jgi:hypothetical protein
MKLLIRRIKNYKYSDKQTIGNAYYFSENNGVGYTCRTLELPWKDNEKRISCIPDGEYEVIKHTSPKFGECFWIQDVPDRSEILIHDKVNFVGSINPRTGRSDLLGCIAPFESSMDIDGDGILDIAPKSSTVAMKKLLEMLPDKFTLKIEWN